MRHKPTFLSAIVISLLLCVAVVLLHLPVERAEHAAQRPEAVAPAVAGFTLVESGFSGRAQPLFGIEYAIQAPYEQVSFQGETFIPTRNHSSVVFPGPSKSDRYVVTETLLTVDEDGRTKSTRLSIIDTESGQEVASRTLREGQIEDRTGWVGSHALKFVRTVIPPPPERRAPHRYWNQVKEQSLSETHPLPLTESKPFEFVAQNCPSGIEIKRHGYPGRLALDTTTWRFVPKHPLSGAFCSDRYVIVVSDVFPNNPLVDVLRLDGSHFGTLELGIPGDLLMQGARLGLVENGRISGRTVTFELHYVKVKHGAGPIVWTPYQRTEVQVHIPEIE